LELNGAAATGEVGMEFRVYSTADSGSVLASTCVRSVQMDNGVFTVLLDFGPDTDLFGNAVKWLEIDVGGVSALPAPCGAVAKTTLERVPVLLAPAAMHALNSENTRGVYVNAASKVAVGGIVWERDFNVFRGMLVDGSNSFNGSNFLNTISFGTGSGEAIGSNRTPGQAQYGLELFTSFSPRLTVLNDGRIGAGNRSPAMGFEVSTPGANGVGNAPASPTLGVSTNAGSDRWIVLNAGLPNYGINPAISWTEGSALQFNSETAKGSNAISLTERARFTPAGDFQTAGGIGVRGDVRSGEGVSVRNAGMGIYDSTDNRNWRLAYDNVNNYFYIDDVGVGRRLYIDGSGNVGIGQLASPGLRFQVDGNAKVNGTLTKGAGSFMIDHPLDPTNKYLYHSFVESPDMMNIYNGNVRTDEEGLATVVLPDYFEALNTDFRYQLTVIDEHAPEEHFVRVVRRISGNTFVIKSKPGNLEVSWQVTGVRNDPFARSNRIPTEVQKPTTERGSYMHPAAYQASEESTKSVSGVQH